MKKFAFCLSFVTVLFVSPDCLAQLFVNNSYVYVADKYLYVKQDVNLQSTGNIYLRNESQLLQGTAGNSTNQGTGKLAVFQEGTVNNFAYNYWCSPVGVANAATGNDSFGITILNRPTSLTTSSPATMLPSSSLDGSTTNSSLSIAPRWIFKFLSSSLYSQWFSVGASSTILPGEGFTMKGSSGTDTAFSENAIANNPGSKQRYDFRGKPNDGNITINVATGMRTLTGNPYPCAIDLKAFLVSATNSTGIAYFWEQDKTVNSHYIASYRGGNGTYSPMGGAVVGGYGNMGIYTPAVFYAYDGAGTQLAATGAGSNYERRFSPVGQGFMIEGSATGTVIMTNNVRVYQKEGAGNYSQFERQSSSTPGNGPTNFLPAIPSVSGFDYTTVSTAAIPQIRFNTLLNNEAVRQSVLAFLPTATDGVDFAMDAKSPDPANTMDMYFVINNGEYIIEAIDFDINKRIPIGFKNPTPANFKIAVGEIINFDGTENVYIHDKELDIYHNIKNMAYEMELPAGTNNTRYEITFVNSALGVAVVSTDGFDLIQNNASQTLTVSNPKSIDLKSVSLYDITGKLIFSKTKLGIKNNYQFSTSGISDAVYIVKILTANNEEFGKKVTVYNGK